MFYNWECSKIGKHTEVGFLILDFKIHICWIFQDSTQGTPLSCLAWVIKGVQVIEAFQLKNIKIATCDKRVIRFFFRKEQPNKSLHFVEAFLNNKALRFHFWFLLVHYYIFKVLVKFLLSLGSANPRHSHASWFL